MSPEAESALMEGLAYSVVNFVKVRRPGLGYRPMSQLALRVLLHAYRDEGKRQDIRKAKRSHE